MLAFLVQALLALQGATKRHGSHSSHLSGAHLLSPPFVTKAQGRNALFASPILQFQIRNQGERLDWLQERLVFKDEDMIELVKQFPKVHALSIEEQLKPTLDWLQARIGPSDVKLGELVHKQPAVLGLSVQGQLEPNTSWLQDRLALDQESPGCKGQRCA
jgi:hypothetical protein